MVDLFKENTLESPARHGFAITPHDTTELAYITRAIYVGGDGDIVLVTASGVELTFTNLIAGTILPVRAKIVKAATSASNLVALC